MFVEHRPQLLRAAFKVLGNTHWVQDSFLKLNEAGPLSEIRQPLASLFQMMRNLAVDAYRRAALSRRAPRDPD